MTTIGSKLLKLRNSRNLSVNALAFELDIPQPTLHRIESDITHKIDFKNIFLTQRRRERKRNLQFVYNPSNAINQSNSIKVY